MKFTDFFTLTKTIMKLLINILMSLCLFAGILFGLHYLWVVTIKVPVQDPNGTHNLISWSVALETWSIIENAEGVDEYNQVEDQIEVDMWWKENAGDDQSYLSYPYQDDGSVTWDFIVLWRTQNGNIIFSYKVRSWGYIDVIASKRDSFIRGVKKQPNSTVEYVDRNGIIIATGDILVASQVVFIEVSGYTFQDSPIALSWINFPTGTDKPNSKTNTLSTSCLQYQTFYHCIIADLPKDHQSILDNQLQAYFTTIQTLTTSEQNAKCTNLLYAGKTSIESSSIAWRCIGSMQ